MSDEGIFTHADVVRTLPPSIRRDFLPEPRAELMDLGYVCSYPPGHDGFMVEWQRPVRARRVHSVADL